MKSLRHSAYHKSLRSGLVVTAFLLAFSSGAVVPDTRALVGSTGRYLANVVGMTASVQPNELNTIASDLARRAEEIERKERAIDARARADVFANPLTTYILAAILILQLVLIVSNYIFDYRRMRRIERGMLVSRAS